MKLLDMVSLTEDIPDANLKAGECGTIVDVFQDGAAFDVEFIRDGVTVALEIVAASKLQKREAKA